jgi:hypothetical protein
MLRINIQIGTNLENESLDEFFMENERLRKEVECHGAKAYIMCVHAHYVFAHPCHR